MAHKNKTQKLRRRWNVSMWYPRVNDLQLPDVPPAEREQVRSILGWLGKLPIRGGTCWQTAQAVAFLSRDSRVQYVEGAWRRNEARHEHSDDRPCICKPLPHAWNLVNNYPVDLIAEFHHWRFGGKFIREPLNVFTLEDIRKHEDVLGYNFSLSGLEQTAPHLPRRESMSHEEYKASNLLCVFKPAIDRVNSLSDLRWFESVEESMITPHERLQEVSPAYR